MKVKVRGKISRREFLKGNLLALLAFLAGGILNQWAVFQRSQSKGPNTNMHPARYYKEWAG